MLCNSSDLQHALEYVAAKKKIERYQSVMDFLFCELFPIWRFHCFRFYNDAGPPLREQAKPEQLAIYDAQLAVALNVAYKLFCEQRCKSWGFYREQFKETLRVTA
jgi:hypothetical protein